MNISKENLEKAKTAKTVEELFEIAKTENIELTKEETAKAFAELHKEGELADDELDSVGGGCSNPNTSSAQKFHVGDKVYYYGKAKAVGPRAFPVQEKVNCTIREVRKNSDGSYTYVLSNGKTIEESDLHRG